MVTAESVSDVIEEMDDAEPRLHLCYPLDIRKIVRLANEGAVMRRIKVGTLYLMLSLQTFLGAIAGPAHAQDKPLQDGKRNESANLILGTVSGDPGKVVGVPVYFVGGENQPVQSLHVEVEFVSNSVKFAKADKGPANSESDFEVMVSSAETPPDANNIKRTRISLDFSTKNPDTAKSLPDAILSFLDFDVPTDAKSYSIELKPVKFFAKNTASASVQLKAEPGKLIVTLPDEPLAGCFFFTH